MRRINGLILSIAVAASLIACTSTSSAPAKVQAVQLEKGKDGQPNRLTLTQKASERLGVQLAKIAAAPNQSRTVPTDAIIYDLNGNTWVFVGVAPFTFERRSVTVTTLKGKTAFLSDSPALGTEVATVGVAELYGADQGLGY